MLDPTVKEPIAELTKEEIEDQIENIVMEQRRRNIDDAARLRSLASKLEGSQ